MLGMIIAIDFDKTLIEPLRHPLKGYKLKPHAKEVIEELSKNGHVFVLNTARYGKYRRSAVKWIKKQKLPIDTKNHHRKAQADLYVDDSNIFCTNIDWLEIKSGIERKSI